MFRVEKGTFFTVLRFPHPWPPQARIRLLQARREATALELYAEPNGALFFTVAERDISLEHRTQPIELSGPGSAVLAARWRSGSAEIFVGRDALLSQELAGGVSRHVRTTAYPVGNVPAWSDPDSLPACASWVEWRARNLASRKNAPPGGRRLKSQEEQTQELLRATRILHDLSALVQQGQTHLLGHLAAELRALIYWNGRRYDPLLLRLAARKGVPLPVYVVSEREPPPFANEFSIYVRRGEPSIVKTIPTQVVVDLQEWLESKVLSEQAATGLATGRMDEHRHLTVKDLIAGVADTLGAAHYDQDLPRAIEDLAKIEGPTTDEVTLVLLVAASVVTALSLYIVRSFETSASAT